MSSQIPSSPQPTLEEVESYLQVLLLSALPRCVMSFVFEITGFTCFVAMLCVQLTGAWFFMGLGALCLWQAHGLMRHVSGCLERIRQLHQAHPALKTRHPSVAAFIHKYARLTGHAPQQ